MRTVETTDCGNCEKCPMVIHGLADAADADDFAQSISEDMMSPMVDELLAPAILEAMSDESGGFLDVEGQRINSPEELAVLMRKTTAQVAEHVATHTEESLEKVEELVKDCEGPLKMRARKNGRVITATVCTSPSLPDGFACEDVHIDRS